MQKPEDVEHVNAHATSTPVGDIAEYTALERVFGSHTQNLVVTATKSSTGHLLGGAVLLRPSSQFSPLGSRLLQAP